MGWAADVGSAASTGWDPGQYLRFGDERARPFLDLLARVAADDPAYVVDLGCGPGTLTALLAQRWPRARVEGLDSSPEMIEEAAERAVPGRLGFRLGDLREWRAERPVDVLVSNATLHWVPGHLALLARLVAELAPGGELAVQVPGNFRAPSHTLLAELRESPRWRARLGQAALGGAWVHEPEDYLATLVAAGARADVWETTYLHVLPGPDAVLEWAKGTTLRPVLAALDAAEQEELLTEYGAALREAYPERPYGTVLPFRRLFAVARAPG